MFTRILTVLTIVFSFISMANAQNQGTAPQSTPQASTAATPHVMIQLKDGIVEIELFPDKAPNHVKRFLELTQEGFYDGIVFHRVIDGFMVQTGDPTGTGMGGSSKPDLKAEFNDTKHVRGILSMARSASPNSANSQFFIVTKDSPHLDGQYTAFGRVVSGMEFVDKIKKGDQNRNGTVSNPDKMLKVYIKQ